MKSKVKIIQLKNEVLITIRRAEMNEILYCIGNKEYKLKRIYDNARERLKIRIVSRENSFKPVDKEKIKRALLNIVQTEIKFDEGEKKTNTIQEEKHEIENNEEQANNDNKDETINIEENSKKEENDFKVEEINIEKEEDLGLHAIKSTFERAVDTSETKFIHGNLRSGQREEFVGSVVIIGDVNYGAEVIAGENIVVTGTIRGIAHAGANGNKKAIIASHAIDCTQVRIANVVKELKDTEGKLAFIYLQNDDIIIDFSSTKSINE